MSDALPAPAPAPVASRKAGAGLIAAKDWPTDRIVYAVCALLGIGMLWKAGTIGAVGLPFRKDLFSTMPALMSSLLVVSLFVERVIEVFVSAWADRQCSVHEQQLDYWQARRGRLQREVDALVTERDGTPTPDANRKSTIDQLLAEKRSAIEDAETQADAEEKALLPFGARTQKVSMWIGLVVGMFTAAVGLRFLSQVVDITPIYNPADKLVTPQFAWFIAADVLLTGTVLAGGSKLIHNVFSVYESFMESTQKSLSDRSKA